jgi:hypothetical protein
MTGQNLKMSLRVAKEENDFCILIRNFDFLSLPFDISIGFSHCLERYTEQHGRY